MLNIVFFNTANAITVSQIWKNMSSIQLQEIEKKRFGNEHGKITIGLT